MPDNGEVSMPSVMLSEKTTGLRIDYQILWQMNIRILIQEPSGQNEHLFVPMYWVERRPAMYKLGEHLEFASLKDYGDSLAMYVLISWLIYVISYLAFLFLFFNSSSCTAFQKAVEQQYAPFKPEYI